MVMRDSKRWYEVMMSDSNGGGVNVAWSCGERGELC